MPFKFGQDGIIDLVHTFTLEGMRVVEAMNPPISKFSFCIPPIILLIINHGQHLNRDVGMQETNKSQGLGLGMLT